MSPATFERLGLSDRECAVVERAIEAIENIAKECGEADPCDAVQQIAAVAVGVIRGGVLQAKPVPTKKDVAGAVHDDNCNCEHCR